jgi:hypothetical protein
MPVFCLSAQAYASVIFEKMASRKGHILWALPRVFKKTLDGALRLIQPHTKRLSTESASKGHENIMIVETAEPIMGGDVVALTRPKVIRLWAEPIQPDEFLLLQERFADWIKSIGECETQFKKHVYENPNMSLLDVRQHRVVLYALLNEGEDTAVDFLFLKVQKDHPKKKEIDNFVKLVDQKLDELRKVLHAWHGKLEHQEDVPQSFKDAIAEFERGELEPFDDILEEETA